MKIDVELTYNNQCKRLTLFDDIENKTVKIGSIEGNNLIWTINIEEEYQNNGYGTALLEAFKKEFRYRIPSGYTHKDNISMRRVFEKTGFVFDIEDVEEELVYYKYSADNESKMQRSFSQR